MCICVCTEHSYNIPEHPYKLGELPQLIRPLFMRYRLIGQLASGQYLKQQVYTDITISQYTC